MTDYVKVRKRNPARYEIENWLAFNARARAAERGEELPETVADAYRVRKRAEPERDVQRTVFKIASRYWWAPGLSANVPERHGLEQGRRAQQQGQRRGEPDLKLVIPGCGCRGKLAVCELKAERYRPKREIGELWWLDWARELAADEKWHLRATEPRSHGLSASQALTLAAYWETGVYGVLVAYSAIDAVEFFDDVAGTRPVELPWMW